MSWKTYPENTSYQTGLLQDLSRLVSDWVWEVDKDARFTFVSMRIFDILKIPPLSLIGSSLSDIGVFVDDDENPVAHDLSRPFRDRLFKSELTDAQEKFLLISSIPVFDNETGDYTGARGIARDVTRQRHAESEVSRMLSVFDVVSEVLFIHDKSDRLVFANQQYKKLNAGILETLQPGTRFEDHLRAVAMNGLTPDAVGREDEWVRERLEKHQNPGQPFELYRQGGQCFLVSEKRLPDGGIATFSLDITNIKQSDKIIQQQKDKHRQFVADIAHELRTPLGSLVSNLDSLKDCDNATALRQDVMNFSALLDQLLMATRFDGWNPDPDDKADLVQVCKNALQQLAPNVIRQKRSLEFAGQQGPVCLTANSSVLEHAIQNLLELIIPLIAEGASLVVEIRQGPELHVHLSNIKSIDQWNDFTLLVMDEHMSPVDNKSGKTEPTDYWKMEVVKRILEAHKSTIVLKAVEKNKTAVQIIF